MILALIIFALLTPNLSLAQNLPNGLSCDDLIAFADGRPPRARKPNPKDAYDKALLEYGTQLCRRLGRKEVTVDEFNVLFEAKQRQLTLKRNAELNRQNQPRDQRETAAVRSQLQEAERRKEQLAIQAKQEAAQRAELLRRQQQAAAQAQRKAATPAPSIPQSQIHPLRRMGPIGRAGAYEIEVSYNDELFIINGEKYEAQTYCFNMEERDSVIFIEGSPFGACVSAVIVNLRTRDRCEVWCE
jgi:hypothetical protein